MTMQLLVIRHGDAGDRDAWARTGKDDDLRPLSDRGKREMERVARGLEVVAPRAASGRAGDAPSNAWGRGGCTARRSRCSPKRGTLPRGWSRTRQSREQRIVCRHEGRTRFPALRPFIPGCVALIVMMPLSALAQTISGTVVSASLSSGIPGVIVQLSDSAGAPVARTLSRVDGRFYLRAAATGRFTIRTLRLGFRASIFGPFVIADGGLPGLRLALEDVPVSLEGLRITSSARCTTAATDEDGSAVLTAWEEARKSLLSTILSRGSEDLVVTTTTYERVVTPETGRVLRQSVGQRSGRSDRPFISPLSPERYAVAGYRETDSAGTTYRAPDADVLVSREFGEAHCLRLAEGTSDREVGVAFGPRADVPAHRPDGGPFVDVEGVLWLDRQSNHLLRADFRYTGIEKSLQAAGAGGALEFLYLPTGLVVVSSWSIRVPRLAIVRSLEGQPDVLGTGSPPRLQSRRREMVGELWEFGGELTSATIGDSAYRRETGADLYGVTTDATSHRAAPRTRVTLAGTSYAATSDSAGRYRLHGVLPGRYDVVVHSDIAAHLQLATTTGTTITLRAGEARELPLQVAGTAEAIVTRCGQASDDRAAIFGVVTTFADSTMPDALISASWDDSYTIQTRSYGVRRVNAMIRSDSTGRFFLCGVRRAQPIRLTVVVDSTASAILGSVQVRVPQEDAYLRVNLPSRARLPAEPTLPQMPPRGLDRSDGQSGP